VTLVLLLGVLLLVFAIQRPDRVLPSVLRLTAVIVPTVLITAYLTVPFALYKQYLNASPYLQRWKYDSYGANAILSWLLSGEFLDLERLPVLTLLLVIGIAWALFKRTEAAWLALMLFSISLLIYFGRPTWGQLANLLPLHEGLILHRFSAGVDLASILLIGLGGQWIWRQCLRLPARWSPAVFSGVIVLLMLPALRERYDYYAGNAELMRAAQSALDNDSGAATIIATLKTLPPARTYAGLPSNWGTATNWGGLHFSDLLTFNRIPAVSVPYQSLSLNSDFIWHFNDNSAADYSLFNIKYVVAPSSLQFTTFFTPIKKTPRYTLYQVPGGGYAQFGQIVDWRTADSQRSLFNQNRAWILSADPTSSRFVRWSYLGSDLGPGVNPWDLRGTIISEKATPGRIDVIARAPNASTLIFKMTYHPNWRVEIDGREQRAFMVSPSFIGVTVPAGTHVVSAIYKSNRLKDFLLLFGVAFAIATAIFGKALSIRLEDLIRKVQHRHENAKARIDAVRREPPRGAA
jgi:hypothetical protein